MKSPYPLFAHVPRERVGWEAFLAEAQALASELPERRYAINLSEDRYQCCLGLAACLLRGLVTLLPPDRSPRHLRRLERDYPDALVLTDTVRAVTRGGQGVAWPSEAGPAGELPGIDAEQLALIAFTSGSTGTPQAHPRTWGSLCESARLIDRHLGGVRGKILVATVPPQHMYGLELSVLLPLCRGAVLDARKPFFPADVVEALRSVPEPRVLVTTPVHLRALVSSGLSLPSVDFLVSATAPLDPALARLVEQRYGAPLLEIYGCTEAGSIAGRRTALGEPWTLYEQVSLQPHGQSYRVLAPHLPEPAPLNDALRLVDERRFLLEGRATDIVNIAGKRGSLTALNRALLDIEGIEDGAFFLPDRGDDATPRLMAFVVAPGLANEDILRQLKAELDPAFLPRTLCRLPRLPRNATGKLPREELERLLDRLPA